MMPVALASTSAVAYGISDYLGGVASRRARALRVVSVSYPLSIVLVGAAAVVLVAAAAGPNAARAADPTRSASGTTAAVAAGAGIRSCPWCCAISP